MSTTTHATARREDKAMGGSAPAPGSSAERSGQAWSMRARDWSEVETQQQPTYEAAIEAAGIGPGQTVLDAGCGSGAFLRAAADHGASVCGLDAARDLLEIARERVPEADLAQGDLQHLPYVDDCFDAVCGFNSFFFADDMVAALREAGRVAKPGAPVVIQVWGAPERFELGLMKAVLARFTPPRRPQGINPAELWRPGALEALASQAGLIPEVAFNTSWAYEFDDEAHLARAMMSAGGFGAIVGERQAEARDAIVDALAGCRTPDGGYRLDNEWHYLIARAA
jgi:SAM-dependent methyltransferase